MKKIPVITATFLLAGFFAGGSAIAQAQQAAGSGSSTTTSSKASSSKKKTSAKKRHAVKREPVQKAPTPDRIREIQASLARNGFYQGEPSGKWDANTMAAMQKFQSENGLEPTGKLDAISLQKLGLGSSVAGVSAPRPPAPAAAPGTAPSAVPPASSAPAKPSAETTSGGAQSASTSSPGPPSTAKQR